MITRQTNSEFVHLAGHCTIAFETVFAVPHTGPGAGKNRGGHTRAVHLIKRCLRYPRDHIGATGFENLFPSSGDENRREIMMMNVDDPPCRRGALTCRAVLMCRCEC